MPALLIADVDIKDPEAYSQYRSANPDIVKKFGGRYVAVGGIARVIEGDWNPRRTIIIEFPDLAAVDAFYDSPEYCELRKIRWGSAETRLVAFETVAPVTL